MANPSGMGVDLHGFQAGRWEKTFGHDSLLSASLGKGAFQPGGPMGRREGENRHSLRNRSRKASDRRSVGAGNSSGVCGDLRFKGLHVVLWELQKCYEYVRHSLLQTCLLEQAFSVVIARLCVELFTGSPEQCCLMAPPRSR